MEVILREGIDGLGKAGEIVKVKDGFARNYLLPQKKAVVADPKNVKLIEHQKRVALAQEAKVKKEAENLAAKLSNVSVTIAREAGEEDKIFGSVTAKDIADSLKNEGVKLDKKQVFLKEPIKKLGTFDVEVKLYNEVSATVKVWVVKK